MKLLNYVLQRTFSTAVVLAYMKGLLQNVQDLQNIQTARMNYSHINLLQGIS